MWREICIPSDNGYSLKVYRFASAPFIKDGEVGKKKFKKDDDKTPVMHFSNLVSSMQLIVSNQSSIVVLLNT